MRSKLDSAQFRQLNETLYTSTSQHAVELFQTEPDLFRIYHTGYAEAVNRFVARALVSATLPLLRRRSVVCAGGHSNRWM